MPASGADWYQPGDPAWMFDPVGQSPDYSGYFALSPGGRFPGDLAMYEEWLAAQDPGPGRDPGSPNPGFTMPEWLKNSKLGLIFRQIERDQQAGGIGPISDPLGAGPAYFPWSGPGARFGPEGGPLHGVLDQGGDRLGDRDYGPDVNVDPGAPRSRGGGGGGINAPFAFKPYGGTPFQSSFVDWQPTQPFMQAQGATRMVPGLAGLPRVPSTAMKPPAPGSGGRPDAPDRGGGGGGRVGRPRNPPLPALNAAPPGSEVRPDGRIIDKKTGKTLGTVRRPGAGGAPAIPMTPEAARSAFDRNPQQPGINVGSQFREGGYRGYDVGYLDKGSPGWMRDPTTGILNTSGFPTPTPPSPRAGESTDEYMTRLHDMGFDQESIFGLLSGWGTGPVMRDPNTGELVFAKDASAWVGPDAGERRPTDIFFQGKSPEQLAEEDRRAGITPESASFLRGGSGGVIDFLSDMFRVGSGNLY